MVFIDCRFGSSLVGVANIDELFIGIEYFFAGFIIPFRFKSKLANSLQSKRRPFLDELLLIKIHHVLEDNLLLVVKGFAVSVLIVEAIKSLSDDNSEVVSNFNPYVVIDFPCVGDSFEDLNFSELYYIKEFSFEFFLLGFLVSLKRGELASFLYHGNLFLDKFVKLLQLADVCHLFKLLLLT